MTTLSTATLPEIERGASLGPADAAQTGAATPAGTATPAGRAAPAVPTYDRAAVTAGIVHFGVGAFHRAHEAMFVDRLLAAGHAAWGICGVGVLPADSAMRNALAAQDGLYTLVTRAPDGTSEARVIGSIVEYLLAPDDPQAVLEKLASPEIKIVSLTVTEGGYPVDDATGLFDPARAGVGADLDREAGALPSTVFGYLTEGLKLRRERGLAPFTVMSCDNIASNGHVARTALVSFAALIDPELGAWIDANVAFPNSMVDRITPATTDAGRAEVSSNFGIDDAWPVLSESFEQWVLEDDFPLGRPPFEQVGVQVVPDVVPYELMKLRLLNASHQAMSYLGLLAGYEYVHEVCRQPLFVDFLLDYMTLEASPTLAPVPGVDIDAYRHELIARFSSEAIKDTLARQTVDGSTRIPKFVLPVLRAQLAADGPIERVALVVAAWSRFLERTRDDGGTLEPVDALLDVVTSAVGREAALPGALLDITAVFGDLGQDARFRAAYIAARRELAEVGAEAALRRIVAGARQA